MHHGGNTLVECTRFEGMVILKPKMSPIEFVTTPDPDNALEGHSFVPTAITYLEQSFPVTHGYGGGSQYVRLILSMGSRYEDYSRSILLSEISYYECGEYYEPSYGYRNPCILRMVRPNEGLY